MRADGPDITRLIISALPKHCGCAASRKGPPDYQQEMERTSVSAEIRAPTPSLRYRDVAARGCSASRCAALACLSMLLTSSGSAAEIFRRPHHDRLDRAGRGRGRLDPFALRTGDWRRGCLGHPGATGWQRLPTYWSHEYPVLCVDLRGAQVANPALDDQQRRRCPPLRTGGKHGNDPSLASPTDDQRLRRTKSCRHAPAD